MDVVWFAEIKWDYLRTRKQQIIRRRPEDVSVVFLEPWVRGRDNDASLRATDGIRVATVPFVKAVPGGLARLALDAAPVRALAEARARAHARRRIAEAGFSAKHPAVVVSNPYAVGSALATPRSILAYDCNDAHDAFPGMPGWTRAYYERTARAADAVFVTSQVLREDIIAMRGSDDAVEFVGNGVEFAHFDSVRRELGPPRHAGVRVGYVGAIAPWFDFDAVARLAHERPEWEITLVGPVMLGVQERVAQLAALDNVSVRAAVSYDDVPRVLHEFTIGIIPFRYDALTRGVNPNKMYEYLAMGLPVAATRFSPEVESFGESVRTGLDADGFVRACDEAVSLVSSDEGARAFRERAAAEAARYDWAAIAQRFWSRLRDRAVSRERAISPQPGP
jgi:glycosyltransferase involved in cell wall biosynthesis